MKEAGPMHDSEIQRVGDRIAEARRGLGIELEDVAEKTRIPLRHLIAIEASNYEALPASTYSVGFVKTYARLLGLDADAIGAEFREERGEVQTMRVDDAPFEPADPSRVPSRLLASIALVTALVIAVIYILWRSAESGSDAQLAAGTGAIPAKQAAAPQATAPKPVAPAAPAPLTDADKVELTATDTVWIKVTDSGKTLFMGELAPGQTYAVPPEAADPRLVTGRPYALRAMAGTQLIPAVSPSEKTIRNVSLKAPALAAFAKAAAAEAAPANTSAATAEPAMAPARSGTPMPDNRLNMATTPSP